MIKIKCKECDGTGKVDETLYYFDEDSGQYIQDRIVTKNCPSCETKGFELVEEISDGDEIVLPSATEIVENGITLW